MIYLKEGKTPLNFAYNDEIIQEGNSKYQLSFKFPTNNPLWEELVEETLLLADDLHGEQEFIIFEVEKHHAYITVYANQVATLLNNYSITELSVNNASGDRVMRSLVSSIIREHQFTFSSDIANTHSLNLKNVTVANALFKDKHSIIGQWGGDLIRDKYDIRLLSNGGTSKEALFMYKKNLKSYQQKKSIKDLRTRIHFTKTINSQKEGEKDKVIAVTVDSPLMGKYKNIYEGNLDVSDQDVSDEATLRKYGENYFKTTLCDVIEESIEIDVIGTPDEPVGIFDTVTIFHEKFNLDVKKKITKYTYSPMGRKLKTIGFGKIQSNLGTTLATMVDKAVEEKAETMLDAFKIQKNLAQLLKLDRKGIEDKLVELEEKSKGALEVKRALFEQDGTIPEVVKTKILDAVEGDIGRLKTIITEAELIKAIQAKLNYAEIKNALIDKAFINQIISDEKFTQQFEDGEVTTQNIFTKLKDSIKSNISKEFVTKDGVRKLVNDLTIDADGIKQITQQESSKVFEKKKAELKGINSYLHKKYSDYADGRNMSDNSNLKYIGIYTGDKQQAPTNASDYSWTKIRGEDGARGRDGNNGRDGVSNYIHRKYSDYSSGYAMDDNSSRKYIGIYTGTSSTPPSTASSYLWSKIKGEDGANGTPGVKGADGRTPYFHTAYSNSATGDRDFSTTNSTGKEYIGTYSDFEVADSTDYRRYKWVKIKGEDGERGRDGQDGKDGEVEFNMLKGTKEFLTSYFAPPDSWQQAYIWVDETERYEDFAVKSTIYQFNGLWQNVELEKGKTYEYGFYAKGSRNTNRIYFNPAWDSSSAKKPLVQTSTESINFDLTTDWKFYSFRFTVNETGWSQCRVEKDEYNNGIKLSICGMYLKEVKNNQQTPLKWSPSIEDLQGHSLTANLRMEGKYINSITTDVKAYLDVFYDGQKIIEGFNAQVKFKGGLITEWSNFWNANIDNVGRITNLDWGNREQNGTPLEVIVLVTYKGLNTVVNERMENVPDVTEIKETVKKYKIFESTLDRFNSTIGQVREQVVNGNRNYITNSGNLSDKPWYGWDNWEKTIQNGTVVFTKIKSSGAIGFNLGLSERVKDEFQNETMTWGIDIRASREVTFGAVGFETNGQKSVDVTQNWQRITHTFVNKFSQWYLFTFYNPNINFNVGDKVYVRFPKLEKGSVATEWTVAPEDVNLLKETTESSIEQTNRNLELKVSKDNVIASINASVEKDKNGENRGLVKIKGDVISDYLYGKTIEGATIKGGSKIQIGEHGYMMPSGDGLRFCLPEKPNAKSGVGVQMLGNYGRDGSSAYGLYVYIDPNFDTREVAGTNSYLMTVNGYISTRGINNLKFQNYTDGSTAIGVWNKDVSLLFDSTNNDIFYQWKNRYSLWNIVNNYYNSTSDARLKKDIKKCDYKALDLIDDFKFKSFNWKYHEEFGQKPYTEIGLIAQEVEKINKNFVAMAGEYKTLNQFNLLTYSLKAIQELSTENQQLKSQLNEMNERLTKLEDKINGNI